MASLARRPDGKWRARYRDDDGKEISRHFGRRVDAQRWLDEIRATQLAGTYVDPAMGRQTFQEFAETWRAAQPHRPTTRKNVAQHLNRYVYDTLGDRPLAAIRPSEVQAWATAVSSRLAPSTVRTVANTVKAVFAAAVRDRIIVFNPCDGLVLPQLPRRRVEPLTIDQVQAIYGVVPDQYRARPPLPARPRRVPLHLAERRTDRQDLVQPRRLAAGRSRREAAQRRRHARLAPLLRQRTDPFRAVRARRLRAAGALQRRDDPQRLRPPLARRRGPHTPGHRSPLRRTDDPVADAGGAAVTAVPDDPASALRRAPLRLRPSLDPPRRTQPLTCFADTSTQKSTPDHGAACGPDAD